MPLNVETMQTRLRALLGDPDRRPDWSLEQYLAAIPRLDALADLPQGTRVLVRGDLDAKPGAQVGEGDIRLRSMLDTLKFGRQRGWVQILFGHIGRDPDKSLEKVRARLAELLGCEVALLRDWFDEGSSSILDDAARHVAACQPGDVVLLENTRKYEMERLLWKARLDDVPNLAPRLAKVAQSFADRLAVHYVHEAFSAGSLDTSSTVVPAAMQRVALGRYEAHEFDGPLRRCLGAQLVVFSGLKTDKLDDLEAIVSRGQVRMVLAAGSLAMALKKAAAQLEGQQFSLGKAEDPAYQKEGWYIAPAAIEKAQRMLRRGRDSGVEFVLPVDFVLQDGRVSPTIGPQDQQFDIGPQTSALYENAVGRFIEWAASRREPGIAFYNGVFGKFEDPQFAEGTRRFISQLKRLKDSGIEVYVGGGEGGTALSTYGQEDWVTHVFTAGGTVLNALGGEPVPYLLALAMAAQGG